MPPFWQPAGAGVAQSTNRPLSVENRWETTEETSNGGPIGSFSQGEDRSRQQVTEPDPKGGVTMPYSGDLRERTWAAGLWDGEGSCHAAYWGRGRRTPYVQASMSQSNPDGLWNLRRFHKAVEGLGKIKGPYLSPAKRRNVWQWEVNGYDKLVQLRRLLWPRLGKAKRAQFNRMLRAHDRARYGR